MSPMRRLIPVLALLLMAQAKSAPPDLQGVWAFATLTPLERPAEFEGKPFVTAADNRDHPADNPENRSLQERCLAFNAGPPIQVGPYNNFVQLLQFGDRVVIFTEMIHDARVVWLDRRPFPPEAVKLWLGASRGKWEGGTLVVETKNFNGKVGFRGTGEQLRLVERFTRLGANGLVYEFTVDDPDTFTRPWTGRMPMTRTEGRIYEYGCHEGNHALEGILRGARYAAKNSRP
jgi:hypothetical protein